MSVRFWPCLQCSRHVKGDATSCPFCGAKLATPVVPARTAAERLSRAALFAAGMGVVAAVADCGPTATPLYGAAVVPTDASNDSSTAGPEAATPDAATPDAATPDAATLDASDATASEANDTGASAEDAPSMPEEVPTAMPLYGGPVPAYGTPVIPFDASGIEDAPSVVALYGGLAPPGHP